MDEHTISLGSWLPCMCLLISSRARGTLGRGPVPRSRNDVNRTPSTPPPSSLVVILTSTGSRLVTLERLRAVVLARTIPRCTTSGGVRVGEDSVFVPCSAPPLPANCVVSERPLWEVAAPVYSEKRRNPINVLTKTPFGPPPSSR